MAGLAPGLVCGWGRISGAIDGKTRGRCGGEEARIAQRRRPARAWGSGGASTAGQGTGGAGTEPNRPEGPAQRRAGEDGAGLVDAGTDGGVIALDRTNTEDGALYAGDPGGEPHEPETGTEAGTVETTPFGNRKGRMKNQNCHVSRTDPFT